MRQRHLFVILFDTNVLVRVVAEGRCFKPGLCNFEVEHTLFPIYLELNSKKSPRDMQILNVT